MYSMGKGNIIIVMGIYEGNFEFGIKRGNGKFIRNFDNIIFEGNWNDNLPNGNGLIKNKGSNIKGFWRNGVFIC